MSRNPFSDEDEQGFGCKPSTGFSDYSSQPSGSYSSRSRNHNVQGQIMDAKSRTLNSQQRALQSMANSEQVGIATAEELDAQGEKIKKADVRLDEMQRVLQDSDRQITSLSSVFGGLKNMFSRRATMPNTSDKSGVNAADKSTNRTRTEDSGHDFRNSLQRTTQQTTQAVSPGQTDVDRNLALMSAGMSRLKGLAMGLETELQDQNTRLDRMAPKMERVNETTTRQTRQLDKLLGGSK